MTDSRVRSHNRGAGLAALFSLVATLAMMGFSGLSARPTQFPEAGRSPSGS